MACTLLHLTSNMHLTRWRRCCADAAQPAGGWLTCASRPRRRAVSLEKELYVRRISALLRRMKLAPFSHRFGEPMSQSYRPSVCFARKAMM